MTTLNVAFELKLALEDKGYESGLEKFNIPTPLRRTSKIHHVFSIENASFDPALVTPHSTRESCLIPVHRRLEYSPSDDADTSEDDVTSPYSRPQVQYYTTNPLASASMHTLNTCVHLEEEENEEEDFQTVPLDNKHWTTENIPDRTLCIHKHPLPHELCLYPWLYAEYCTSSYFETMDLSDI